MTKSQESLLPLVPTKKTMTTDIVIKTKALNGNRIINGKYQMISKLGKGAFANVKLA